MGRAARGHAHPVGGLAVRASIRRFLVELGEDIHDGIASARELHRERHPKRDRRSEARARMAETAERYMHALDEADARMAGQQISPSPPETCPGPER